MRRHIAILALLLASPTFAHTQAADPAPPRDRFVIADDACGASRFAHLVGEPYTTHRASLPQDAVVHGRADAGLVTADAPSPPSALLTLEYKAQRLNVVLDAAARIIAIACH